MGKKQRSSLNKTLFSVCCIVSAAFILNGCVERAKLNSDDGDPAAAAGSMFMGGVFGVAAALLRVDSVF